MRLWLKQSILALTIILLTVSACLYFFTAVQTNSLLDQAHESGFRSLNAFCGHLSTLDATEGAGLSADSATKTALVQYTFATYAHLLQSAESAYSLAGADGYLYNVTQADPLSLLPLTENDISASRTTLIGGTPYLVQGVSLRVMNLPITVYLTRDLTDTYASIARLTRVAQLALGLCLVLCGTALPLMLKKSLRPLKKLTKITQTISDGRYDLRADIASLDEVGELSASFDRMAETVEQKIESLEDTAKRRELLLGALTHEMKTPMTAIIGYAQSLLAMPLSENDKLDAANEIYEAARRTERLSQKMMQLISLTESPALVKRSLDVPVLFEQVERAVSQMLAQKRIALTLCPNAATLYGDGDLLFSLMTNLIDNAAKASPEQSVVVLSAEPMEGHVRLTVSDHGGGIPADKIALVTEPFYRVDKARSRKSGGAGLGLSICRMIAEAHGGTLSIESALGEGTTITIDLPNEKEAAHA